MIFATMRITVIGFEGFIAAVRINAYVDTQALLDEQAAPYRPHSSPNTSSL